MRQLSLIPDEFELQERALAALDELDLAAATRLVDEARARDPLLPNLETVATAIAWLAREVGGSRVDGELLALLFHVLPSAHAAGEITPAAAAMIDTTLARLALRLLPPGQSFLDGQESVHRGQLLIVLKRPAEARALLVDAVACHADRADLWTALAESCSLLDRGEEANAAIARALLLDPAAFDALRIRNVPPRTLLDDLVVRHGESLARELLLAESWLAGLIAIPPDNRWLDSQLSRLHLAASSGAPTPERRARRFTLLLYLDRSRGPGQYEDKEREEMQALLPETFERVIQRIRALERTRTRPLRW